MQSPTHSKIAVPMSISVMMSAPRASVGSLAVMQVCQHTGLGPIAPLGRIGEIRNVPQHSCKPLATGRRHSLDLGAGNAS
jgi:hypothetical protein